MTSVNVVKDGVLLKELFVDVDKLVEGDRLGVQRSIHGDLIFYINGEAQEVAASNIPRPIWAVVNLYGKCAQVSITNPKPLAIPAGSGNFNSTICTFSSSTLNFILTFCAF